MTKRKEPPPGDGGDVGAAEAAEATVEVQVDLIARLGGYANMISQGAEARVFSVQFLQRQTVVKQRFAKTYRHPALDAKLTRSRLNMEARSIVRARKLGVVTPTLYYVDTQQSAIYMEYVAGRPLKDLIRAGMSDDDMRAVGAQVGKAVAALHDGGLIHGDLTTSNIMVRDVDMRVVVIDFGLAHNSIIPEDKGVDLYVLERAITVTHAATKLFEHIMAAYKASSKQWSAAFNKFAEVRMRGRKRSMIG
mmetsp:Transcript_18680/g.46418  ORF Transcript_18680/g.46418 Transcript_18680/m.46418 type:complete len:249 (-) Transcript_18680:101-847(-)